MEPPYSAANYKRAVGFVLRKLRRRSGMTQEQAAADAGMDRPHLADWEAGKHEPGSYRLGRILWVYGAVYPEAIEWIERRATFYAEKEKQKQKRR